MYQKLLVCTLTALVTLVIAAAGGLVAQAADPEASSLPGGLAAAAAPAAYSGTSEEITWSCTSTPCPWGNSLSNPALVWPGEMAATSQRHGYTTSSPVYLPAPAANGLTITVTSGSARIYAGAADASSHAWVGGLSAGESHTFSGIPETSLVSVQGDSAFGYELTSGSEPTPTTPTATPTATPTSTPTATPGSSQHVTWSCTTSPCPWGSSLTNPALVWPAELAAASQRHGYTTSSPVYLPAQAANGLTITITSGSAAIYSGAADAGSHSVVTALSAGQSHTIAGVGGSSLISVQSGGDFGYELSTNPNPSPTATTPTGCTDPTTCTVVDSITTYWHCDIAACSGEAWVAQTVNWPSTAAYPNNARQGDWSRTTKNAAGDTLYPYAGPWIDGCQVKVVSGIVLVVEWQRGTNDYRQTWLSPGETHVIDLVSPEDNALIESADFAPPFKVELTNCTPQPIG